LCIDDKISCISFKEGVIEYDFPFDETKLPVDEEIVPLSRDGQLMLGMEISKLMKEFFSPMIENCISTLLKEFGEYDQKKEFQFYDDESNNENIYENHKFREFIKWARKMKQRDKEAVVINNYRRELSSIFQRYMVLFRVGKLAHDMFQDIDWPGKGRIKTFINICKPLDYYNFVIAMKDQSRSCLDRHKIWVDSAKPKVYEFLEVYLVNYRNVERGEICFDFEDLEMLSVTKAQMKHDHA